MQRTENLELAIIESNDPFNYTTLNENTRKIDAFAASGSFPSGGIIIWSGSSDNIPTGWALCNGENNTPDLRDRFVLGAGNSYTIGDVGGESSHKLTVDEMPSHTHEERLVENTNSTTGKMYIYAAPCGSGNQYSSGKSFSRFAVSELTATAQYPLRSITTTFTGGSSPHNNMPPYYALCYIMKL